MFLDEMIETKYNGFYRGKVEKVDIDKKNGLYKVCVYPLMVGLDIDVLPYAQSNLTTRYRHIQLYEGDWVWVFFENGDFHYPIIFDLCNAKDNYPTNDLGEYGKYSKIELKDKVNIEVDEDKGLIKIIVNNVEILIDDTNNITVDCKTNDIVSSDGGEIKVGQKITIKNTAGGNLKALLEDILSVVQNIITPANMVGNLGAPVIYTMVANDLPKIITAKTVTLPALLE